MRKKTGPGDQLNTLQLIHVPYSSSDSETDSDEENSKEQSSLSSYSVLSSSTASDSSDESSVTEESDMVRQEITLCCYHSQSHRKSKFLGCIVIPITDVLGLDPGILLTQRLPLEPKRGQSHKHVQGELTLTLQNGTVHELLTKILKDDSGGGSVDALKKSKMNRKRNEEMSKKVDILLDHHWNNLETVAKERVDKQLVVNGVVKAVKATEPKLSYIEQVMLGLTNVKKKAAKPVSEDDDNSKEDSEEKPSVKPPPQTPAEARRSRLIQAGVKLQPLNEGVKQRREAGERRLVWKRCRNLSARICAANLDNVSNTVDSTSQPHHSLHSSQNSQRRGRGTK